MVAKSFQNMEMLSEPYEKSGKMYIRVRNPKTGTERQVRWYTEKEYNKMYPGEKINAASQKTVTKDSYYWSPATETYHNNDPYWKPQKDVLGFTNGYITIFIGNTFNYKEYLKSIGCKYTKFWGWGLSSELELPADFPEELKPTKLEWSKVGNEETGKLLPEAQITQAVDAIIYGESKSQYMGVLGERIEILAKVTKAKEIEGAFGVQKLYILEDNDSNVYVWVTSSQKTILEVEKTYKLRGTVKTHRTYHGENQTVLIRCNIVK